MGGSTSSHAHNYEEQLEADKVLQTWELPSGLDNATAIHVDNKYKDMKTCIEVPTYDENMKTLYDVFQRGVTVGPQNNCLGTRAYTVEDGKKYGARGDYVWENYTDVNKDVMKIGGGLLGLGAVAGDHVGILSTNKAEWIKMQHGIYSQSMIVVSLYATLGADAVEYIANHAELKYIATGLDTLHTIVSLLPKIGCQSASGEGKVGHIIVFDANEKYGNSLDVIPADLIAEAKEHGVEIVPFSTLLASEETKANPPKPEDLSFIMYTSGTTGKPKGAMLTHANVVSAIASVDFRFVLKETDVHISYLPLAHIFETAVECGIFCKGASVGFFQGNVKLLTADMAILRPTLLCGVPRVFDKFYKKYWAAIAEKPIFARWFVGHAYAGQCANVRTNSPRDASWDAKAFQPFQEKIGLDRCVQIITGAAPCPPYLMEFLKVAVNSKVIQGYGMTETSAIIAVMESTDPNMGHVGVPMPCCHVVLADVPEMNYMHTHNPPTGEVWVKGPNVFKGYFKNPEATAKDLVDGWLRTGDVGRWNPNGTLSIIDRKKNIFKIAQGEYIAAEMIELVYGKSPAVGQIWIYGNSYKANILAVVVPNAEFVFNHAITKHGWWPEDKASRTLSTPEFCAAFETLCTGPFAEDLKAFVFNSMKEQNHQLNGFQKVLDIVIEGKIDKMLTGFTEENECMTPTFKLRRPWLLRRYVDELKALYAKHGQPNGPDEHWGEKKSK